MTHALFFAAPDDHPLRRILSARDPRRVVFRTALVATLAFVGVVRLIQNVLLLFSADVYRKDFIQEYLLARAVLAGVDPYLPLPALAERFLGALPAPVFPHPTPHPPPVALLSLPFGLVNYRLAAGLWLGFELLCIAAASALLLATLHRPPTLPRLALIVLIALVWSPMADELAVGQLMALLLLLLVCAWRLLRVRRDLLGGSLLGLVVAFKLMAWPVVLFLLLRRKWRAVLAAGVTVVIANLLAGAVLGWGPLVYYYRAVAGIVSPLYRSHAGNFAAWSVGWRLFAGTGSPVLAGLTAPPLLDLPGLALVASLVAPAALLVVSLSLASRARRFDTAFAVMTCASILLNPVAWSHYLVLALLPAAILFARLAGAPAQGQPLNRGLLVAVGLWLPTTLPVYLARLLAGQPLSASVNTPVSFLAGLTTLFPALALLGLLWLAWKTDPQ